ncbi:DNA-directed DNA polymerase [Sergentomyia squamirostris]
MNQLLINFKIKKPRDDAEIDWLEEGFNSLIDIIKSEATEGQDKIVKQLYLEENSTNKPIFIGLRQLDTLTTDIILTSLEKVQQSTSAFSSTDVIGVRAFLLQSGEGRGRDHNPTRMTGDDLRQYKRNSIIDLDLQENCLPNALVFDSLCFIPFALSKFSTSFGLPTCEKGEYPYKFNKSENRNYVGRYPPIKMYPIDSMSSDRYLKFMNWYKSRENDVFDNHTELIRYCKQDVKILMLGCLNFMSSFLETSGLNPFLQAVTIADAVMKVYRKNYLKDNTLAITPKNNYSSTFINMQSKIGLKWLIYMKMTTKKDIKYEVRLKNSRLVADGYDEQSNTVYSFEGCFYHGHTCILNRDYVCSGDSQDTIQNRYEKTLHRWDHIRKMGYNLIQVWECDFRRTLKNEPEMATTLEIHPEIIHAGFDPRDAVYGGRTEVFRLHHKCRPGDRIYYFDFTSLYPWANKYTKYFVGHPTILTSFENPEEILNLDGIAKISISPPRGLYIPVLPYKCNKRLLFPLCRSCAEMTNMDSCTHSENERLLTGTWSLDEIRLAVEHGYKIYQVLTVWQYKTSQYNRECDDRGLFADYVDNFLKIKQQSSGWPAGTESDAGKEEYVREYLEKEGILLDAAEIRVNKGMRSLAKIVLNSLWGRFIMRDDHPKTKVCNSFEDLNNLISSENIEILDFYFGGPKQLFVSYKCQHEADAPVNKYGNIGVGICTTTNARIKLYSVLSKLGRNLFYCDTDSMIYVVPNGQKNPLECGKFLGELTDEIEEYGENSFIEEFVSCGPKAYGLKINLKSTNSYKYKIVFKGITMNRHVEQKICFQGLKDMVFGEKEEIEVEYSDYIVRRKHFKIESGPSKKKAQFSFTKRRCIQNFDTVPFGY